MHSILFSEIINVHEKDWKRQNLPSAALAVFRNLPRKTVARRYAEAIGLKVPTLYEKDVTLEHAIKMASDSSRVKKRFVLKPSRGSGSVGVFLLEKHNGAFLNLMSGDELTSTELLKIGEGLTERFKMNNSWLLEELFEPANDTPIIDDVKLYTFHGKVSAVLVRRNTWKNGKRGASYRWFSPQWEGIDVGIYSNRADANILPPVNKEEIIDVAEKASRAIPVPFMRIDLYDASNGVSFGEFTPTPGGVDDFSPEWRDKLVNEWEKAARDLSQAIERGEREVEIDRCIQLSNRIRENGI